jgi:hypothetical protein
MLIEVYLQMIASVALLVVVILFIVAVLHILLSGSIGDINATSATHGSGDCQVKHQSLTENMSAQTNEGCIAKQVPEWERSTNRVIKDMKEREAFGLQKYGKYLHKGTDEDMLQHLYEELMDAAVYIKTLIDQRNEYTNSTRT